MDPLKFIGFFYTVVDVIFKNIFLFVNILKLYFFYIIISKKNSKN